jgi:hypothetical protein
VHPLLFRFGSLVIPACGALDGPRIAAILLVLAGGLILRDRSATGVAA